MRIDHPRQYSSLNGESLAEVVTCTASILQVLPANGAGCALPVMRSLTARSHLTAQGLQLHAPVQDAQQVNSRFSSYASMPSLRCAWCPRKRVSPHLTTRGQQLRAPLQDARQVKPSQGQRAILGPSHSHACRRLWCFHRRRPRGQGFAGPRGAASCSRAGQVGGARVRGMLGDQAQALARHDPRIPALVPQQRLDLRVSQRAKASSHCNQRSVRCSACGLNSPGAGVELHVEYHTEQRSTDVGCVAGQRAGQTSSSKLATPVHTGRSGCCKQQCGAPVSAELAAAKGAPLRCRSPAPRQPCGAPQWSQLHIKLALSLESTRLEALHIYSVLFWRCTSSLITQVGGLSTAWLCNSSRCRCQALHATF